MGPGRRGGYAFGLMGRLSHGAGSGQRNLPKAGDAQARSLEQRKLVHSRLAYI